VSWPFKFKKKYFSALINFSVSCLVNVAVASKFYCSIAPQALSSDGSLWRYAITVIAFVALRCKFISPCGVRINPVGGSWVYDYCLWRFAITDSVTLLTPFKLKNKCPAVQW
jgi:hypothetical protein